MTSSPKIIFDIKGICLFTHFSLLRSFDVDPLRRHTFWTILVGGTFTWLGIYGVNQSTIQRCISCKTEKHAKL